VAMHMVNCPNCGKATAFKRSLGFGTFFTVVLAFSFWVLAIPLSPLRSGAQTIAQTPADKPIHDAFEATNIIPVSCEVEDGMVSADVCRFFINALYVKLGKHSTVQAFDDTGEDEARKGVLGASGKISFFMSQRLGTHVVLRLVETGSPGATRLYVGGTAYDPSGPTIRQQSAIQAMQNLCASEGGTGPECDAVKQEESKVSQQPNHQLPVWSAKEGIGRDTGPTEAEKAAAASELAGDFAAYWYKVLGEQNSSDDVASIRKAAEQGDADAQAKLGSSYYIGQGVPRNYSQAFYWYSKAAEQGDPLAQSNLGVMYHNGQGVPQDDAKAVAWSHKAAEQGDADAQNNLGASYYHGQGLPQDYGQAYFWLALAASGKVEGIKHEDVVALRDAAASHLTPTELSQVQARVRKWLEDHPPKRRK
jgi:Sel1 repeat